MQPISIGNTPKSSPVIDFAVVGDPHCGSDDSKTKDLVKEARRLRSMDFVITAGDNTVGGLPAGYEEFVRSFTGASYPFYAVRGNHDRGAFGTIWGGF